MNIDRRDTRGPHIYSIRVHAKLAKVSKCRLCFGTGDFASFDIYARGEYLVVRTLNDTILCVRGCGKFRANSRKRERERRENDKKTNPRSLSKFERVKRRSRNDDRKKGKNVERERLTLLAHSWTDRSWKMQIVREATLPGLAQIQLENREEKFYSPKFLRIFFSLYRVAAKLDIFYNFFKLRNYSIIFILFNHLLWSIDHKQKKYLKLTNKLFTANSIARFRFYPQPLIKQRFNAIHVYDDTWKKRLQGSETFPSPRTPPLDSSFRPPIRKFWTVRSANFCIPITR